MNSVLVGYQELLRPRFVLSASAFGFADNTNLCVNNSSYPTRPHSIIVYYVRFRKTHMFLNTTTRIARYSFFYILTKLQVKMIKNKEGLTLDENLTWKNHIEVISKKFSSGIGALKRVRGLMDRETAVKVYKGFIEPYFSYCAPVWDGIGVTLSDRLQKLQNRAARVITQSTYDISSRDLLNELQWNSLSINRDKQKAIFMFKTLNGLTPQYLEEMFSSRIGHYTLRDSNRKLFIPKPNTDYLKRSFSYSGASLWNSLPESLRLYITISYVF